MPKEDEDITKLEETVEELTKALETAVAASEANSIEKATIPQLKEALAKAKAKLDPEDLKDQGADESTEDAKGKLKKLEEENALLKALAAMTPAEKVHCDGMSETDTAAFLAKSVDDRKKDMKKKLDGDEVIKVEGQEIRKSVVGDAQFNIIKAQDARLKKADEDIVKERDARELSDLRKRADDEFPHVPGDVNERAEMLKAVAKMDEPLRKSFEVVFTQSEKLAKTAFETVGHKGTEDLAKRGKKNGVSDFEKKVDEIHKSSKSMTRDQAMSKARQDYPTEFEAYNKVEAN